MLVAAPEARGLGKMFVNNILHGSLAFCAHGKGYLLPFIYKTGESPAGAHCDADLS